MTSQGERDIRERLAVLNAIEPSPAPVHAAVRQGRTIRLRRRVSVAAGLAVVAATAVLVPGVLRHTPTPPTVPPHYSVTVNPPPAGNPHGVIGSGTIDGKPWRVIESGIGKKSVVTGTGQAYFGAETLSQWPATLQSGGDKSSVMLFGTLAHSVSRLTFSLPNGTVLDVRPVRWHGQRWFGVMVPQRVPIARAVAYSGGRQVAHAFPFRGSEIVAWLHPGERGPARESFTIASGAINGTQWSIRAEIGPWGYCLVLPGGGDCTGASGPTPSKAVLAEMSCGPGQGTWYAVGSVQSSVSSLRRFDRAHAVGRFRPRPGDRLRGTWRRAGRRLDGIRPR
jgi:hypothetical protein